MMNRFVDDNNFMCSPLPDTFATELSQHIPEGNKLVGLLLEDNDPDQCWGSYFIKVIYYILLVTFAKK